MKQGIEAEDKQDLIKKFVKGDVMRLFLDGFKINEEKKEECDISNVVFKSRVFDTIVIDKLYEFKKLRDIVKSFSGYLKDDGTIVIVIKIKNLTELNLEDIGFKDVKAMNEPGTDELIIVGTKIAEVINPPGAKWE